MADPAPPAPPDGVPCPGCGVVFTPPVAACPACGVRLTGPDAVRLWEVKQSIASLEAEAAVLLDRLRAPAWGPAGDAGPASHGAPGTPAGQPPPPAPPRPRGIGGQQILLGIGALLALSAASVFILAVWLVVGFLGQALLLLAATLSAALGARAAARRNLPAAAETAAVLATGLLLLDVLAAHARNLGGLGRARDDVYWLGGCLLMAAVLLGFDALVPRRLPDGTPARTVWLYRPAAALGLAVVPWLVMSIVGPGGGVATIASLAAIAAADGLIAWLAQRLDMSRSYGPGDPWGGPASAWVAAAGAVVAVIAFYAVGIATGYQRIHGVGERYGAAALLLLPALVVAAYASPRQREDRRELLGGAGIAALPAVGVPLCDAPWQVLWAASVPVLVLAVWLARTRRPGPGTTPDASVLAALLAQPVLFGAVMLLWHEDVATFGDLLVDRKAVAPPAVHAFGSAPLWVLAVPGLLWALGWAHLAWRQRSADAPRWVAGAEVALLVSVGTAVGDRDPRVATLAFLALAAAEVVLGYACHTARRERIGLVALGSGAVAAVAALVVATSIDGDWVAAVLLTAGVLTLGYGGAVGRVVLGYAGSVLVSAGLDVLMATRDVATVEAYSLPLAALLAAVGLWHWRRDPGLPTVVTTGPTLTAAVMPTLLTAIGRGDDLRLAVVTLVAIALVVLGLSRRWKGPVTVGSIALVLVALTQGGPLIASLGYFVTAGAAGALLIAIGVMWESAIARGRAAVAWYSALR